MCKRAGNSNAWSKASKFSSSEKNLTVLKYIIIKKVNITLKE